MFACTLYTGAKPAHGPGGCTRGADAYDTPKRQPLSFTPAGEQAHISQGLGRGNSTVRCAHGRYTLIKTIYKSMES